MKIQISKRNILVMGWQIYEVEDLLGEGGFATVRTGKHKVALPSLLCVSAQHGQA